MDKVNFRFIKYVIFALLLFGCAKDEENCRTYYLMTISNANPIQFWVNGKLTYNEQEVCGINPACFCQPFNCDDEIKIQVTEIENI